VFVRFLSEFYPQSVRCVTKGVRTPSSSTLSRKRKNTFPNGILRLRLQVFITERFKTLEESERNSRQNFTLLIRGPGQSPDPPQKIEAKIFLSIGNFGKGTWMDCDREWCAMLVAERLLRAESLWGIVEGMSDIFLPLARSRATFPTHIFQNRSHPPRSFE